MDRIKAGHLVYFTEGEYSDYSIVGIFVALGDITQEVYQEALYKNSPNHHPDALIAQLIRMGYLLEVESSEVHLGIYSEVNETMGVF